MTTPLTIAAQQTARAEIEALIRDGNPTGGLVEARRLWSAGADAGLARFLKRHAEAFWAPRPLREHRVAVLRSFTVEPMMPFLEAEAALAGCRLVTWVGAFNAYAQEILAPDSPLFAHRPDTIVLAIQTRDVAPDLWDRFGELSPDAVQDEIDRAATQLIGLLQALRKATSANILCHGLERPLDPSEGFLDLNRPVSQADAVDAVNRRLRSWCSAEAGVYVLDYDGLIGRHGRERWFDEKKFASTKLPLSLGAVGWLAAAWWRHIAVFALPPAKVLALDIDNTLWGGVIGEDGAQGIQIGSEAPGLFYRAFQQAVLDIARRGVLIVLASKNNETDALEVVETHPEMLIRRRHLAGWRINWEPKPANLASLAQELNLGLDSFVFVDDNPAECEAVRQALPEVDVIELPRDPSAYARVLRQIPRLERLSVSNEDAERTRYYVDDRRRRELQTTAVSLEGFLESLEIEIAVEPISGATLARAAQLTQKTNQLNMTTRRYTEAELDRRLQERAWSGYVLRARDRFGDNGIVGLAIVQDGGEVCEIDSFLLSCRIIGRGIETAFLDRLAQEARRRGARRLEGRFLPTPKNPPAKRIYELAGFALEHEEEEGAQLWSLPLTENAIASPSWIRWAGPAEL